MELDFVRRDAWALQRHFRKKRDFLLGKLSALGITVKWVPTATFYVWADLSALPHPIDDCLVFLEEAVRHKVSKRLSNGGSLRDAPCLRAATNMFFFATLDDLCSGSVL